MKYRLKKDLPFAKAGCVVNFDKRQRGEYVDIIIETDRIDLPRYCLEIPRSSFNEWLKKESPTD